MKLEKFPIGLRGGEDRFEELNLLVLMGVTGLSVRILVDGSVLVRGISFDISAESK